MKFEILIVIICMLLILNGISLAGMYTSHISFNNGMEFVGVAHIGSHTYWDRVASILEGATVIYEAVPRGTGLDPIMDDYRNLALHTNTIFQEDGLDYLVDNPDWILSDTTYEELITWYPEKDLKAMSKQVAGLKNLPWLLNRWLFGFMAFWETNFGSDPLVTGRNKKPVHDAIKAHYGGKKARTVILYGQAHRRGIVELLREYRGHIQSEKYYFNF